MKIIKRGQTLEEWLLNTIHTCYVCHTTFQPERGDQFHIPSTSFAGEHVEINCPHCGKRLHLYKPNPDAVSPTPQPTYIPVPYPVYPSPPNPWWVPTITFGTGVGDGHIPGTTYIPSPTTVREPLGWKSDGGTFNPDYVPPTNIAENLPQFTIHSSAGVTKLISVPGTAGTAALPVNGWISHPV